MRWWPAFKPNLQPDYKHRNNEILKWLKGKIKCIAVGNTGSSVARDIGDFCAPRCPAPVLILSYETFRTYKKQFYAEGKVDLLICDEAHRSVALLSSKHEIPKF